MESTSDRLNSASDASATSPWPSGQGDLSFSALGEQLLEELVCALLFIDQGNERLGARHLGVLDADIVDG